jgi:hypothetical protein
MNDYGAGCTIYLQDNKGDYGNARLDKYFNVENLYGSDQIDTLFGNSRNNIIDGRGGND